MSNPHLGYRDLPRRSEWRERWGEDFWVGLLIAGFAVIAVLIGIAAWQSHKATRTASLLDDIQYTRPTLPTMPY